MKSYSRLNKKRQSGQALILSLLAVIAIIAIVSGIVYTRDAGRNEYSSTGAVQGNATPIDDAYDTGCTAYMSQVTDAATLYRQDHGKPPPDLESLKPYGLTEEMIDAPNCNYGLPKNASSPAATPAAPGPAATYAPPSAPAAAPQSQPAMRSVTVGSGVTIHIPNGAAVGSDAGQ